MNPTQAFKEFELELMAAYAHVCREEKAKERKAVDVRRKIEDIHANRRLRPAP